MSIPVSTAVHLDTAPQPANYAHGFAWTIVGRLVAVGSMFVSTTVLARLLTTTEFTAWLLINNVLSVFCLFAMVGTNRTVVRYFAESLADADYARCARIVGQVSRLVLRGTVVAAVVLAVATWHFGDGYLLVPATPLFITLVVIILVLRTAQQTLAEMFRGFHDLANAATHSGPTGSALSNTLFVAMLLFAVGIEMNLQLDQVLIASIISLLLTIPIGLHAFRTPLQDVYRRARMTASESLNEDGESSNLLSSSIALMWIQVLGFAVQTCDLWIAATLLMQEDVTSYASAKQLVMLMVIPLQMVNLTVLATVASLYRQQQMKTLEGVVRGASTVSAVLGGVLLIPLVFAPQLLLGFVYGPAYSVAAMPLLVLAVGQLFNVVTGPCGLVMMMTGRERECLGINIAAVLALTVLGPLAAYGSGAIGLAAVTSLILALQNGVLWYRTRVLLGIWTHPDLSVSRIGQFAGVIRQRVAK